MVLIAQLLTVVVTVVLICSFMTVYQFCATVRHLTPAIFFHFIFILNFLITVAPSTKSGCFSGGRGKNLITMLIKQINKNKKKNIYNVKLE